MNTLNTRLTLNLLKQTNVNRIIQQKPLLYPDDQILSLIQRKIPIPQIDKYSSCDQIFLLYADSSVKCLSIHDDSITHLAVCQTENSPGKFLIICTIRPLAITQISLRLHSSYQISIKAQRISPMVHLWGCKAIPSTLKGSNISSKDSYYFSTPAAIYQKNGRYLFQIPSIGVPYTRIVLYGSNKKPFYERKIYDSELPEHAFTVYQMSIRYFKDFEKQAIQNTEMFENSAKNMKEFNKQNLLQVFNFSSLTLKDHRKSQIFIKEKQSSYKKAGRYTLPPQTLKRRDILDDLSDKLFETNIQDKKPFLQSKTILNLQLQNLKKIERQTLSNFNKEIFLMQKINEIKKNMRTKFFERSKQKQSENKVRIISGHIDIICPIYNIKSYNESLYEALFKQKQQSDHNSQALIDIKQYSLNILELLLSLNNQIFFDKVSRLSYKQIIEAVSMFSQLKMSFICQTLLIQSISSEGNQKSGISQEWADLRLITQYNKNCHFSQETLRILKQYLDFTFSNEYQILQNGLTCKLQQALAFMSQQEVQKLVAISLEQMNQNISEQDTFRMNNRLADLLQIMMGNTNLKDVTQLISKKQSNIGVKQNKYDLDDQILQNEELTIFNVKPQQKNRLQFTFSSKSKKERDLQTDLTERVNAQYSYIMVCNFPFDLQKQNRQTIVSQYIHIKNDLFKLIIEFDKQKPQFIAYQLVKINSQQKLFYHYTVANVQIDFYKKTELDDGFKIVHSDQFYYVWSNSSKKTFNPCNQFAYLLGDASASSTVLMITLKIDKNIIDEACLHYLGVRLKQLIPIQARNPIQRVPKKRISEDLNKRKSCFFLQSARVAFEKMSLKCLAHQYCQVCEFSQVLLFKLTEVQIFGLLQNDNIDIAEQWMLLLFLVKYYYRKQNQQGIIPIKKQQIKNESLRRLSEKFGVLDQINEKSNEIRMRICFLSLRWQFISFKNIISTYIEQEFIRKDPIICSIIYCKKALITGQSNEILRNQVKVQLTPNAPRIRTQLPSQEQYLDFYLKFKNLQQK